MAPSAARRGARHSVAVAVRVRPGGVAVSASPGGGVAVSGGGGASGSQSAAYSFPAAVIEGSEQATAYEALAGGLVRRFCEGGISCTLVAYGQTGSGKTYTLLGPPGSLTEASVEQAAGATPAAWGVFPRAMMALLSAPELQGATFHCSAVEVYMEHAYDLLAERKPLRLSSARSRGTMVVGDIGKGPVLSGFATIMGGVHPSGCSCRVCFAAQTKAKEARAKAKVSQPSGKPRAPRQAAGTGAAGSEEHFGTTGEATWAIRTPADVARMARLVEQERVAHGHALNARSSRSHCLVRVTCTKIDKGGRSLKRDFLFVDLAGSERVNKSGATGPRQKEASNINRSLTTLGRVVREITSKARFVSYRDSVLTMLLRESFAGPSCTSFVICVAGEREHAEETVCSLRFGEMLAGVQTSAVASAAVDVAAQRAAVGAELIAARARLQGLERAGQGDRVSADAPPSEQASLRNNIANLRKRTTEVRRCKNALVEAKTANPGASAALVAKLEEAVFSHDNLRDIVLRQKTIPGLWVAATPAFARLQAQVAALEAQAAVYT